MKTRLIRFCAAALVAVGFAAASPRASADTVDYLTLTLDGGGNTTNGGGPFNWTQDTTSSPLNTNFALSFSTYCVDFHPDVFSGSFFTHTDLTASPLIGNDPLKVAAINTLYDHFYSSSFSSPTQEAGFQLALWELIFDGPTNPDVTTGTVQGGGAAGTAATGMLNGSAWNGTEHDLANASLVLLQPDTHKPPNQPQIVVVPKGVPAPPAALLAGIGALALFGRARWNRKKGTPAA
jgi:hypothetical protein